MKVHTQREIIISESLDLLDQFLMLRLLDVFTEPIPIPKALEIATERVRAELEILVHLGCIKIVPEFRVEAEDRNIAITVIEDDPENWIFVDKQVLSSLRDMVK